MSNADKIKAVMDKEAEILEGGLAKALLIFQKEPTKANTESVSAARKALEDYRAVKQDAVPVTFATKREVISYLISAGWDVKPDSAKVNDDLKGLPKKQGAWSKKVIDEYAGFALRKADGISEELTADAKRKLKADADKAEEDAIRAKRRNFVERGEYIPFSEVEQEFARRLAFLKSDIERFIYNFMLRMIEILEGNTEKQLDAIELGLRLKDEWMDRYSKPLEFMAPSIGTSIKGIEDKGLLSTDCTDCTD